MSGWFQERRREFITATLRQFGQIRRADLVREFDISVPQASADIRAYMDSKPPNVRYDVSAKAYIFENQEL
jgi:hypothetical protein